MFSGADSDPYKFTGKERDAESGLDYFGARYYASNMGRWMSPDWADKPEAVPYSSLDNPQSLNLYGYVLNNPLSHADADGHCCDWSAIGDYAVGVLRGGVSSLTYGYAGAPRSSDSPASLAGQTFGTVAVGVQGAETMATGAGEIGAGLAGAGPTAGASLAVSAVGAGTVAVGAVVTAGAAENAGAIASVVAMKAGGNFSQGQKQAAKDAAGGKCQNCGVDTTPGQKSQKGVTPPGTQGEGDHINPKSNGGTNGSDNIQHLCRDCNAAKGNKVPGQQ